MNQPATLAWSELESSRQWVHLLRAVIQEGKIAEVGTTAWAVLCVIKSYTQFDSGAAWPSHQTIARHIGASTATVVRALTTLEQFGMLARDRTPGAANVYRVVEHVPLIRKQDQQHVGHAKTDYVPAEFQGFLRQLKELGETGVMPPGATFHVTFNCNIITQGDNSNVNYHNSALSIGNGSSAETHSSGGDSPPGKKP